ncbi:MAG TPA: MipA/OmpV family protein [Woeseiaceae bacterium]|nr:MipA/OmpV family protein [Woeseiaceae bacterium]
MILPGLCAAPVAVAEDFTKRIGAYLDSIDLNDYALALNLYASKSLYTGIDNSSFMYPMFSSFESSTTSENSLFVRDANLGLRKIAANGWSFGGFATVYTDGYGAQSSEALRGMQARGWTVAAGVLLGKKLGPVHADLFAATDLLGRQVGQQYDLKLAYPLTSARFQLVPQLDVIRYSQSYVDYYYGVRPGEATPTRSEYTPGAATVYSAGVHLSWRLSPSWYLRGTVGVDFLPDEIVDSPVVDTDRAWSIGLGVAYDSATFIRLDDTAGGYTMRSLDASVEAFFMRADTVLNLDDNSLPSIGLEDFHNLDERDVVYPVALRWRLGRYHSMGLRYFELYRDGSTDLIEPQTIRGTIFDSGDTLQTDFRTRVAQFDYGFAFFNDPQKELIVFGGLHVTDFKYVVQGSDERIAASTTAVLPLIGARARLNPTSRIAAIVSLEIFALDFDRYNGQLVDLALAGEYRFSEVFACGLGYRYYRQKLQSSDDSFVGELQIDYHGPYISVRAVF